MNARRFGSRTFAIVSAITIFICAQIPTPAPFAPIPPQIDFNGTPGKAYVIFRTGNVTTLNWSILTPVTTSASGTATFEDSDPGLTFPAYYRAVGN